MHKEEDNCDELNTEVKLHPFFSPTMVKNMARRDEN